MNASSIGIYIEIILITTFFEGWTIMSGLFQSVRWIRRLNQRKRRRRGTLRQLVIEVLDQICSVQYPGKQPECYKNFDPDKTTFLEMNS